MWGNRNIDDFQATISGSIPSYVGEPILLCRGFTMEREHPLVGGGTLNQWDLELLVKGASPRMWGNLGV